MKHYEYVLESTSAFEQIIHLNTKQRCRDLGLVLQRQVQVLIDDNICQVIKDYICWDLHNPKILNDLESIYEGY